MKTSIDNINNAKSPLYDCTLQPIIKSNIKNNVIANANSLIVNWKTSFIFIIEYDNKN